MDVGHPWEDERRNGRGFLIDQPFLPKGGLSAANSPAVRRFPGGEILPHQRFEVEPKQIIVKLMPVRAAKYKDAIATCRVDHGLTKALRRANTPSRREG